MKEMALTEDPRFRWSRFTLRSLLAIVAGLSVIMAMVRLRLDPVLRQTSAIHALRAKGHLVASVTVDPSWLQRIVRTGRYERATWAYLRGNAVDELDLQHLAQCTSLNSLTIPGVRLDEAAWNCLGELRHLHTLRLENTAVTDRDLEHLGRFTTLQHIEFVATGISDRGLFHLRNLDNLESLSLDGTLAISDATIEQLACLAKLRYLYVSGLVVSDDGLSHPNSLRGPETVVVHGPGITDDSLAAIARLRPPDKLRINLSDSPFVTTKGLRNLLEANPDMQVVGLTPRHRCELDIAPVIYQYGGIRLFGAYEPAEIRDWTAIPEPPRSRIQAHLQQRLGDNFYEKLSLVGGQAINLDALPSEEPELKRKWEVPAFILHLRFARPEIGIECYIAEMACRADGSVLEEIGLPAIGDHPEKGEFVSTRTALAVAEAQGLDPTRTEVELCYRPELDACIFVFTQECESFSDLDNVEVDAHTGKAIRAYRTHQFD